MANIIDTIFRIPGTSRRSKATVPLPTATPWPGERQGIAVPSRGVARSDAPAMVMAARDIGPLAARTLARIDDWRRRRAGRRLLMTLDDRALKDIGLSRCDAEREYDTPFWRD